MTSYEYARIGLLAQSLAQAGVDPSVIEQIMQGGETILRGTSPKLKADWMRAAMQRINQLLPYETRVSVREACACCLGGKREKLAKAIAKEYATLQERIQAANETKLVFGNSVRQLEDGRILVAFAPDGLPNYRCACLPQADQPISVTYCFCCGGHVKHHLQTALGRKIKVQVRSSALSSGGEKPCTFLCTILDD